MEEEVKTEVSPIYEPPREATYVEKTDGPITLRLLDGALWNAFNQEGTEMIITKAGRRMFPFVMVTLEGLSPTLLYSVHLSLVPCDHRQYKFCQRHWVSVSDTAPGPTPTPEQSYVHPASPNRGSFWCQEMVSFAKLKITNNKHSQGDIVLQSMRKYMAQITVREDLGDVEYVFQLPETTFVAVTQYQNEAVTRMKIAHNPFANGFKYAHVTGNDHGKKGPARGDATRVHETKQKYLAGVKGSGKSGKGKAAVRPLFSTSPAPAADGSHHPNAGTGIVAQYPERLGIGFDDPALAGLPEIPHRHYLPAGEEGDNCGRSSAVRFSPLALGLPSFEARVAESPTLQAQGQGHSSAQCPRPSSGTGTGLADGARLADHSSEAAGSEGQRSQSAAPSPEAGQAQDAAPWPGFSSTAPVAECRPRGAPSGNDVADREEDSSDAAPMTSTHVVVTTTTASGKKIKDRNETDDAVQTDHFQQDPAGAVPSADSREKPVVPGYKNLSSSGSSQSTVSQVVQTTDGALSLVTRGPSRTSASLLPIGFTHKAPHHFKQPLPRSRSVGYPTSYGGKKASAKRNAAALSSYSSSSTSLTTSAHHINGDPEPLRYRQILRHTEPGLGPRPGDHSVRQDRGVTLRLHDSHIWHSFAACGSKMVISSDGRHMFPVVSFTLRGLDPGRLYSVWLHVTPADDPTLTPGRGRPASGSVNPAMTQRSLQLAVKPYMHPLSPTRGLAWMKAKVSFSCVRLTSDQDTVDIACMALYANRRYLAQVVVREEEEVTPSGAGGGGELRFFPLPEATFLTVQECNDFINSSAGSYAQGSLKRYRESTKTSEEECEDEVLSVPSSPKTARGEAYPADSWMCPPDLSSVFSSTSVSDLPARLPPLYCMPHVANLPPAHLGLLANRMPLAPSLQSVAASFPLQTHLFSHLRTPLHTAFGMALPSMNPLPLLYYPFAVPPGATPPVGVNEPTQGLDLSLKNNESR